MRTPLISRAKGSRSPISSPWEEIPVAIIPQPVSVGRNLEVRPDLIIRLACGRRHGPADPVLQIRGTFLICKLYRARQGRIFAEVREVLSQSQQGSANSGSAVYGPVHVALLAGSVYRSEITDGMVRPYRVTVPRRKNQTQRTQRDNRGREAR